MSYLKDREVWLEKTPTGNPPAGYYWKFIQDGVVVVRDSDGVDKKMVDEGNIKTINSESILGDGDLEVGGGKVLQVVFASHSTAVSTSLTTYQDTGLTGSITPTSATSEIYIFICNPFRVTIHGNCNIVRGSTDIFTGARAIFSANAYLPYPMNTRDLPATTSPVTYKVQHRDQSGSGSVFSQENNRTSTMILIEVEA